MESRKRIGASLLLAVYLAALAGVFSHRHQPLVVSEPECARCVHHEPHTGHLLAFNGGLSDCVLCHFLGLPYVYTKLAAFLLPAFVYKSIDTRRQNYAVSTFFCQLKSRAPPVSECLLSF